jgi:hypothetical protein
MDSLYASKYKPFRNIWDTIVKLSLKHPALTMEVILNCNYLSQVKLDVFCYNITLQNTVHVLLMHLYILPKL